MLVIFSSCRKEFQKEISNATTTTSNLIYGNTSVSLSQAKQVALQFLQTKNTNTSISIKNAETIVKDGVPYFHIINANKGFAIVASDSTYPPLLAYDSINNFSLSNLNTGIKIWFNKQGNELNYIRTHKTQANDSIAAVNKFLWKTFINSNNIVANNANVIKNPIVTNGLQPILNLISTDMIGYTPTFASVGPLCQTAWDQPWPYNQLSPFPCANPGLNGRAWAGCVPVAMGQIINFWHLGNNYNWAIMPTHVDYGDPMNDPTRNVAGFAQVATLLANIGTSQVFKLGIPHQFASYGCDATGADDFNCLQVFPNFGLSATRSESITNQVLSGANNGNYFETNLENELINNQRPCMVGGYSSETNWVLFYWPGGDAHEWVCDGANLARYPWGWKYTWQNSITGALTYTYSGIVGSGNLNFVHMNWGWGGVHENNNGWYNADVNYTQADPSQPDFQYFQTIITNIHP